MSLAEELDLLANPTPKFQDPEQDDDGTAARLIDNHDHEQSDNVDVSSSQLRRKAAVLLEDEDQRYAGKAISRKSLTADSDDDAVSDQSDSASNDEEMEQDHDGAVAAFKQENHVKTQHDDLDDDDDRDDDDDDYCPSGNKKEENDAESEEAESLIDSGTDEDELEVFKQQIKHAKENSQSTFTFQDDGDYCKFLDDVSGDDDEEEDDDEDEDDEDDDGDANEDDGEDNDDEDETDESMDETDDQIPKKFKKKKKDINGGVKIMTMSSAESNGEVLKGHAAKAQLTLWDSLLEGRIRLQKSLGLVNQLPQPDVCHEFALKGGQPLRSSLAQTNKSLKKLLEKLVYLQSLLLSKYPQTKYILKDEVETKPEVGENEGSDSDASDKETSQQQVQLTNLKRKRNFNQLCDVASKRQKSFRSFRDDTIQKWYEKTRIASGKLNKGFSSFEQTTLKQIQQIMRDKTRLLDRTRLKRTTFDVLGKAKVVEKEVAPPADDNGDNEQVELRDREASSDAKYDAEIFDDSDFYHQLLRELIERKTSDVKDPLEISRQYIKLQSLRKKSKKTVDSRLNKGKKIRYEIHPKLVSFMAPHDACSWNDESRNDLFGSIFGKRNGEEEGKTENTES